MPNGAITSFTLAVPQADLENLNRRIDQTRLPDTETVDFRLFGAKQNFAGFKTALS
jgi:hypothetical protein